MKKLTKVQIKNAPNYIATLDYKHETKIDYLTLKANTLTEAMKEAEKLFDENIYMVMIAEKTNIIDEELNYIIYKDVLASRTLYQWHLADLAHSELTWIYQYDPEYNFIQLNSEVQHNFYGIEE